MRNERRRTQRALPSSTRLPALAGLCGLFALSGPILAAELAPAPAPVKFRVNVPKDAKDSTPVNGFVFEGGAFNPSYSPPPQPRAMPTAMTVNAAAGTTVDSAPVSTPQPPPAPRETPRANPEEPRAHAPAPRGNAEEPRAHAPVKPRVRTGEVERRPEHERPVVHHHEEAPPAHHVDSKDFGGKDSKPVFPLEVSESPFHFSGSAGYYSKYMFRGLDVGYRTGIDDGNDSAFFSTQAAMSYKGFALGVGFIESLDPYVQHGSAFNDDFGRRNNPLSFRSAPKERYKEYDLFANYTYQFTDTLALTAGMNFYWFGDGRSWANQGDDVSNTMETAVSLNYTGLPWVNQTLSYYYDFDAFKGSYLEYKVAAKPIKVFEEGAFSINLIPSVTASVDFRYNGTNNGWNALEPGLDMPIQIADGLVLNLGARYNMDLGSGSGNGQGGTTDRTDDRFWFSAAVQYSFPNRGWNPLSPATYDKDSKGMKDKIVFEEPERPWSISVGAGVRSISSDFHLRGSSMRNVADGLSLGGDTQLATAGRDATYLDGAVYSNTDPYGDGTSSFAFARQSQINTSGRANNRQVQYHSEEFNSRDMSSKSSNHNDDDEPIYPYITLARELWHKDKFHLSVGLGYQYARSETDSGYRLSGQAANTAYTFAYDFDEIFSNTANPRAPFKNLFAAGSNAANDYYVVYNPQQYQATYQLTNAPGGGGTGNIIIPLPTPQSSQESTRTVAAFKRATLDTDLHSLSIPIDFKVDLAPRVHLGVSFGPTFNLFDLDLKTDTYYQLIESEPGNPNFKNNKAPFDATTGQPQNIPGLTKGGIAGNTPRSNASTGGNAPQQASNAKGAPGAKSRNLPDENIAHQTSHHDDQEFKLGLFAQASLAVDLDAAKRWYVEVYARYDYVPEFSISDGSSSSVVDASSLGGGVGLGFRF